MPANQNTRRKFTAMARPTSGSASARRKPARSKMERRGRCEGAEDLEADAEEEEDDGSPSRRDSDSGRKTNASTRLSSDSPPATKEGRAPVRPSTGTRAS